MSNIERFMRVAREGHTVTLSKDGTAFECNGHSIAVLVVLFSGDRHALNELFGRLGK